MTLGDRKTTGGSAGQGPAESAQRVEQIHLRLSKADADLLRRIAMSRDQTISGAVRYLLRPFRGSKTGPSPES
jgi:hypothetical protein